MHTSATSRQYLSEQDDETMKKELKYLGGNYEPIKLFSDKSEKNLVGTTFFDRVVKNDDGSIHLYISSSRLGSGYRLLLFKCGTEGLLSKGNGKILYNSKLENYLKSKTCGKNM